MEKINFDNLLEFLNTDKFDKAPARDLRVYLNYMICLVDDLQKHGELTESGYKRLDYFQWRG